MIPPNIANTAIKTQGVAMSTEIKNQRFIKFIPGPEEEFLSTKPIAFTLLSLVAKRARRESGHPDGLEPGECYIGDHKSIGATRQEYRTALKLLVTRKHFKILETCRTRQKSTTGTTTVGTKVKLLSTSVWDINLEETNHHANHCPTTDQPPTNHEQERRRTNQEGIKKRTIVKESKIERLDFRSPLLEEDLRNLIEFSKAYGIDRDIDSNDFSQWLKKYGKEKIDHHLALMMKNKQSSIKDYAKWMQSALDRDYGAQKENIARNLEFAKEFREQKKWRNLTITKKYCRNEDTQNEYYFYLPPEQFKELLNSEYKKQENLG
jgi:hypothetical protein